MKSTTVKEQIPYSLKEWNLLSKEEKENVPIGLIPFELFNKVCKKRKLLKEMFGLFSVGNSIIGNNKVLNIEEIIAISDGFISLRRQKKISDEDVETARKNNNFDYLERCLNE